MLQIVASGLQDRERLNAPGGSPSIQFYKSVMRKRTRWASQWRRVEFDGVADFGRTAVCTLPIQGELITRATLVIDLPDIYTVQKDAFFQQQEPYTAVGPFWAWTNGIGHAICSDVQMLIGDQIIDRFDSRHLEVLDEQTRAVEHFDSTNLLIARDPSTFSDQQMNQIYGTPIAVPQTNPQTLEIVFPFWWNRGPGPTALPIQALWKDKVQLKVSFRPIQECVYTSTRIDPRNTVQLSPNQGAGPLPNINGCGFYIQDPSGTPIYSAASTADLAPLSLTDGFLGNVITSPTMPTSYHFRDAYWIVEYVSLEDREASAYRNADLEIPIEQHIPMPIVTTGGAENIRIRMDQAGLVRDLTWVAQRVEAPAYNAYFLFSKDLGPPAAPATLMPPTPLEPVQSPCDIPWWPNAEIPNWDYGDGYILPAFADRRSDPIVAAKMQIRGLPRFEHEGPSLFRSLIPALNCKRGPLIDRYIYRYDFGFWPTGGLAEAADLPVDEIRGCSNWDKLPKRELALTMAETGCGQKKWVLDDTQTVFSTDGDSFVNIDSAFASTTEAFIVSLVGASPGGLADISGNNGYGATVLGIVDFNQLKRQKDYIGTFLRTNNDGSSSLVLKTTAGYSWLAVAGAGGYGQNEFGSGGYAGSAVEIGWQGGNVDNSHAAITDAGGIIIYNTLSPTNIPLDQTSFVSYPIAVLYPCIFISVQLAFSLAIPGILIELNVNGTPHPLITPPLASPPDTTIQTYTLTLLNPFPSVAIFPGDTVIVSITTTTMTSFLAQTDSGNLAYSMRTLFFSITPISVTLYGGGGGGTAALGDAGIGFGPPDGQQMLTTAAFVESHQQTGGVGLYRGGDGYYGGGAGTLCGGGGGSYVSSALQQVNSFENTSPTLVSASLTPIRSVSLPNPSFDIYSWVTRYNRLRINSGRGTLMFNEAA